MHPAMVGYETKIPVGAVYAQIFAMYLTLTLGPYGVQWAGEVYDKLYRREDDTEAMFDPDMLTRGDPKSRADYYKASLGGTGNKGWKSINDIRKLEGDPLKGDPDDEANPYNQIATATSNPEQDNMPGAGGGNGEEEGGADEMTDEEVMELAQSRGLI